jgi:cobalt-zinc-cadmium efflux system outer membrane protein
MLTYLIAPRLWRYTPTVFISLMLAGCSSLDATDNISQTARLASTRVDSPAAKAWSRPIEERSIAWDGETALRADAALLVAIQNNPPLRISLSKIVERRADYVQSELLPNPTIGFGIGFAVDGLSGAPAMAQGLQALTWLWTRPDRIAAAEAELQEAILTAASDTVSLAAEIGTAHAKVIAAQHLLAFDVANVEIARRNLNLVHDLHEAGEASQLDVNRATIDMQTGRSTVVFSTRELEQQQLALLESMGWPDHDTRWRAVDQTLPFPIGDERSLLRLAAIQRLDLTVAEQHIRRQLAGLSLAGTRRLPKVDFTLGWQQNFNGRDAVVPGAMISIPILDNGGPAIAKAAAQLEQARLTWIDMANQIAYEVRVNMSQWKQAAQQLRITQEGIIPAANAAVVQSQAAYNAGVTTLVVLLRAQEELIKAEQSLVRHQLSEAVSLVELRRAVGGTFERLPAETLAIEHPRKGDAS